MDYDKDCFGYYTHKVVKEFKNRNINYQSKYYDEILDFCSVGGLLVTENYPEHNDRYLRQCLYNLEEKAIRNIISKEDWNKIYNKFKDFTDLWEGK